MQRILTIAFTLLVGAGCWSLRHQLPLDDLDPPPPWDINALRDTAIDLLAVPASWVEGNIRLFYTTGSRAGYRTIARSHIEDVRVLMWSAYNLGQKDEAGDAIMWVRYRSHKGDDAWALMWMQRTSQDTSPPAWQVVNYYGRDHFTDESDSFFTGLWHYRHNPTLKDLAHAFPPIGENGYIEWEGPLTSAHRGLRLNTWEYALGERPEIRFKEPRR